MPCCSAARLTRYRAESPSSLLERRPDILQAEQSLIAANADIGAAKAQYFPQLSLTGTLGSVSAAFGNFLTGPASTWTVLAGLTGPIFTAGSIAGQVHTAEAGTREAVANYQSTVLTALRETNDALVGSVKKQREAQAQALRVTSLQEYARLGRVRPSLPPLPRRCSRGRRDGWACRSPFGVRAGGSRTQDALAIE